MRKPCLSTGSCCVVADGDSNTVIGPAQTEYSGMGTQRKGSDFVRQPSRGGDI